MRTTKLLCLSSLLSAGLFASAAEAKTILPLNTTDVTLSSAALGGLTSLGIAPAPTGTATISGATVSFPITGGTAVGGNLTIDHDGSDLSFTKSSGATSTVVDIGNFVVSTQNLDITGFVEGTGLSTNPQRRNLHHPADLAVRALPDVGRRGCPEQRIQHHRLHHIRL